MYGIHACKRILVIHKVDREICITCILLDSFGIYEVSTLAHTYLKAQFFSLTISVYSCV